MNQESRSHGDSFVTPALSANDAWNVMRGGHMYATVVSRKRAVAICNQLRGHSCQDCRPPKGCYHLGT